MVAQAKSVHLSQLRTHCEPTMGGPWQHGSLLTTRTDSGPWAALLSGSSHPQARDGNIRGKVTHPTQRGGRAQNPRLEESGSGSSSVALSHMDQGGHEQESNGKRRVRGNFIPATRLLQRMQGTVRPLGPSCILARKRLCGHGVLGMLPRSPHWPSRLQTSGGRNSATRSAKATEPASLKPPPGSETQAGRVRPADTLWGSPEKDRSLGVGNGVREEGKASGPSLWPLGPLCPPSCFPGPYLSVEGWQGFRRFPACHVLWLFQKRRPGKPSSNPVGTGGARGQKPSAFLQAPESVLTASSPYCSEEPPCISKLTKEQPC